LLEDGIAEIEWRLAEAVRLRLVSDVPIGAFLSGGVDSTAVVIQMAKAMDRPVRTFTVGFASENFDERPFARQIAERYGTDHTELVVETPVSDIISRLAWHYDEPFGDSSAVPSYLIAELTRQYVTVVLNGDGADESFAGYDWYKMDRLIHRAENIPSMIRHGLASVTQHIPVSWKKNKWIWKVARLAEVMTLSPCRRYSQWVEHFGPKERRRIFDDGFITAVEQSDPDTLFEAAFTDCEADDWLDVLLRTDTNLYLPDDLLVKMDRATMANSLEARSPFLDHLFMEFAASLPVSLKLAWGQKKRLLKNSLRGRVCDKLLDRPKMGFSVPVAEWFRNDLKEMAYDILLSPRSLERGYFAPDAIKALLKEHSSGVANHGAKLWDLLMLELWHEMYVDQMKLHAAIV
jgi:asparagine synthase (glutamine-hydrolysing)